MGHSRRFASLSVSSSSASVMKRTEPCRPGSEVRCPSSLFCVDAFSGADMFSLPDGAELIGTFT
jgi:hypothetical protein